VVVAGPASGAALATLRHTERFDAAVRQIPLLAPLTEPGRFESITPVMRGGLLTNTYQGQFDADGTVALARLFFVGDAMSTTNPRSGRGVSLGLQLAATLVRPLDHDGRDHRGVAQQFDAWCAEHVRPWFDDQVHWDSTLFLAARATTSTSRVVFHRTSFAPQPTLIPRLRRATDSTSRCRWIEAASNVAHQRVATWAWH
jgi:2-polyprenyl-6-methoxyphenol hydroxylase-like FAD-dependent oxidoreductase